MLKSAIASKLLLWMINIFPMIICDEDYESFNHIPLQDLRVVRSSEQEQPLTNLITENPFEASKDREQSEDFSWLSDAIKDAAYYIRGHKFNEFDRRYESNSEKAAKEYYGIFPKPPLRTLHWEAKKYCDPSFLSCIEYLKVKLPATGLHREDDTSFVMLDQKWNYENQTFQIKETDAECNKLLLKDDELADPFLGPLERFQWRTTVSYYMCWYTMNEVEDLKHFNESCDNFAHCLSDFGANNGDGRAADSEPFRCAMYSFCPDPCCPRNKHLRDITTCDEDPDNPCYIIPDETRRRCTIRRADNTNFYDMIINRWNVSCDCPENGFRWNSKYSLCVDIDECSSEQDKCNNRTETCLNLPGSYLCACRWGFAWNETASKCVENSAVAVIKLEREEEKQKTDKAAKSLVKRLFMLLHSSDSYAFVVNNVIVFTSGSLLLLKQFVRYF